MILDETEDDELSHLKTLDSVARKLGINVIKWDKGLGEVRIQYYEKDYLALEGEGGEQNSGDD